MKKINLRELFIVLVALFSVNVLTAQVTFEELTLQPDTFWNGADRSGGFTSDGMSFVNYYDTTYYSWSGFAYTNMTDTITAGYANMYSSSTGSGYSESENYVTVYDASSWGNTAYTTFAECIVEGFYITNNTYAYLSMKNGDYSGKVFGSTTDSQGVDDGTNGEDWFLLTVNGYNNGSFVGNVEFYLADFRFTDSTQDYIVKNWQFVDLSSLNTVDSLTYTLSSSDNGQYGMNTPAYFCMDNVSFIPTLISSIKNVEFKAYPNPCKKSLTVKSNNTINKIVVNDILGNTVFSDIVNTKTEVINTSNYVDGIYFVNVYTNNGIETSKIIKK